MAARYIFRLDDIAPNMHWDNYLRVRDLFDANGIRPLLGVIPDNQDPELLKFPAAESDFWDMIRGTRQKGWEVAQHGFQHQYVNQEAGLLGIARGSEFAGLPYEEQYEKLQTGRQVLQQHGIETDVFMAPSHSFDENTLRALQELGFSRVTDGFALYPYMYEEPLFVPQILATHWPMPLGVHTCCMHLNGFGEKEYQQLERFVKRYARQAIPFSDAHKYVARRWGNREFGMVIKTALEFIRKIKHALRQTSISRQPESRNEESGNAEPLLEARCSHETISHPS